MEISKIGHADDFVPHFQKNMKIEDYKKLRKNKYRAKKVLIDGIKFASKKEADYYVKLLGMQKKGLVSWFICQPPFNLISPILALQRANKDDLTESIASLAGSSKSKRVYKADFLVVYADGKIEIIDTKGFKTDIYKLKKHLVEKLYPFKIVEI